VRSCGEREYGKGIRKGKDGKGIETEEGKREWGNFELFMGSFEITRGSDDLFMLYCIGNIGIDFNIEIVLIWSIVLVISKSLY
jgi:hypothetical protein